MRTIISGIAAAAVFGIIAAFVLRAVQVPAFEAFSTSSTRLGDPGSNLIGRAWSSQTTHD